MISYTAITSLDGYIADADGRFDWSAPDLDVHAFVNDLERSVGTYLYGRRMYDVMKFWADPAVAEGEPDVIADYSQLWRRADKVVYSTTLDSVGTERTRLEHRFDADAVRALAGDVSIGGATLAAEALKAGIVDELARFVCPVIVGGGTAFLPDDLRLDLRLLDEHRFANGVVYLRYAVM
jgi:dihydrofolate reductase